jgi:gamma-glutamylputrescine oxidase
MLKVYPQLAGRVRAAYGWSGELCYAPHKMPQIGRLDENMWYATCFGGHGLAPTTAGGEIVAAAIAEGDDRYRLFAPFGLWYAGGPLGPYVAQTVYWWWRARDYLGF